MSDESNAPLDHDAGAPAQSPSHPPPPPFDPMHSSHVVPNPHVHSVVPDLMRVYESLTKGNPTSQEGQQQPPNQQQQQQDVQGLGFYQDPEAQEQPPPFQSLHVNYALITSEEHYRQIYQHQTSDNSSSGDPISQHHYSGQMLVSLPHIPAPYDSTTGARRHSQSTESHARDSPEEPPSPSSSSRSSLRRKRSSASLQQDAETSSTTSAGGGSGKSKSRKKAKETDGRWSKRFTWPEELHRDFVSAVFDVGLKHSSPSTVLEHMPKHPQITSERIKSHLQKYRVHRNKSKQEFMSSYEMTLKKFKNGDMDKVKSLSDGEIAAQLSHAALTEGADGGSIPSNARSTAKAAGQLAKDQDRQPQNVSRPGAFPANRTGPLDHEALMLPKLTEAEKSSPIGASMGYLLGLFFSLKKQLLIQRNANTAASGVQQGLVSGSQPDSVEVASAGPVVAVYNSFVGTNMTGNPIEAPSIVPTNSMEWVSGGTAGAAAPPPPGSNPHVQNVATINNLEASSMMKREMQNQMAFQNKMRALKQQELNKYKNLAQNHQRNSMAPQMESNHTVRFKQQEDESITAYTDNALHNQATKKDHNESVPSPGDGERMNVESHHVSVISSMPPPQEQQRDSETKYEEHAGAPDGDPNFTVQGAGETARAPSFSMGGNEDFWSGDVMDEQLFEFLMNN